MHVSQIGWHPAPSQGVTLKTITRLSLLVILVYAGVYFISKNNPVHDVETGGLSAWGSFVPGMLCLIAAAFYGFILFERWNRVYPDLGQPTKADRFITWLSDTEVDMRRARARRRRNRQERHEKRNAEMRAQLGMGPAFK